MWRRERHTLTTPHGSDIHSHIFCTYNYTARLRKTSTRASKDQQIGKHNECCGLEGGTHLELQSRRKEGTERGPRQQVLRSPPALGKKELNVDAPQQVLAAPDRAGKT